MSVPCFGLPPWQYPPMPRTPRFGQEGQSVGPPYCWDGMRGVQWGAWPEMGGSVLQPCWDGGKLSQESGALLPAQLRGWERLGRGQLWLLGLMATTGDSWGYEQGLSFVLPSPLPAPHASVSPVTAGLCWGMGAMEEVDEASERSPRDRCACSHLGPLSSVCPPRGTGDPLPLQDSCARSGR